MKHELVERIQNKANFSRLYDYNKSNKFVFIDDNLNIFNKRNYLNDNAPSDDKIEDHELQFCEYWLNKICVEYCMELVKGKENS